MTHPDPIPTLTRRRARRLFRPERGAGRHGRAALADDTGAATAEYAIATMAAVAFAGLLVVIMRSDEVRGILTDLVRRALTVA
ncbi:DUF4244 domain-containing protein [Microbacterium telephonicum]|uniref:Uncharacterized protein DUF4244 n=1 Tax=Microbacterium telephonicum TaxID=1714841 RepID=A0A498BVI3_9MICO|nr:DUF4244 domain-containing protein [Microbacterium telephonicum]RLK47462.1 uncharacterized protein DUF4244 [Microbacterium telephonicum]